MISISFSFIQDESQPELESVAVGLLTVISDHATVQSLVHYHPRLKLPKGLPASVIGLHELLSDGCHVDVLQNVTVNMAVHQVIQSFLCHCGSEV